MIIPNWLSALTGAKQFANNPRNNFQPTFGDGLQGIGHSMMQHHRGQGGKPSAPSPLAGVVGAGQPLPVDEGDQMFLNRYAQQGYEDQPQAFNPAAFQRPQSVFSRFIGPQP